MRWMGAGILLAVLAGPQSVEAQPILGPAAGGFASGGGISFSYSGKRLNISASFGRSSYYQYGLIGPPVCGTWYGFASPWIAPPPPGFGPPPFFFGANPFFLPPPPQVVVVPQIVVQQPIIIQQPIIQARADEPVEPVKVANPERFIIIQPGKLNDVAPNVNPMARVEKPVKEVDLGVQPANLPLASRRAGNPLAEADWRMEEGRAAFGRGEYGRALDHFRRATLTAPAESTGYFLLAQAQFAVGKYEEAVANIVTGMELRPDWPMSRFAPRGLYKANADAFDFHLRNGRAALEAAPDDPRLLFLLGVELWFDGKRDEARPFLERAARLARDPAPILPFLNR